MPGTDIREQWNKEKLGTGAFLKKYAGAIIVAAGLLAAAFYIVYKFFAV